MSLKSTSKALASKAKEIAKTDFSYSKSLKRPGSQRARRFLTKLFALPLCMETAIKWQLISTAP